MHRTRRSVLRSALALAASAVFTPGLARSATTRFIGYPFTLGVASGYPTPDGVTLWTRLAPAPLAPDGGLGGERVMVQWEVADDEGFGKVVAKGSVVAWPEQAHSVRVDVAGLTPGRWYFYRFRAGDELSPTGRTRTAVALGGALDRLRFGVGSCQHYEQGWFAAHRHLADENLDLMLFLGDYHYESSWGSNLVRRFVGEETVALADYRIRHAQYKVDTDLQRLHQQVPWAVVWDDHEVDNDWAGDTSEHLDPQFVVRRTAAFQAFLEHIPLPSRCRLGADGRVAIHRQLVFGDLAAFYLLDDRQHRSVQACPDPGEAGSGVVQVSACPDLARPERTLLGSEQEAWLDGALKGSRQQWNVLAQQTVFSPAGEGTGADRLVWTDGWDGYPHARRRLLDTLARRNVQNPLLVGGDVHATHIGAVHADPDDPESKVIGSEMCGTSITSEGASQEASEKVRTHNPHFQYVNGWQRGYLVLDLTRERCTTTVRAVDEKRRDSPVATAATFVVDAGRPGPRSG